jgi:hypothetical protein
MKYYTVIFCLCLLSFSSCQKKCNINYIIIDTSEQFPFFEGQNKIITTASNSTQDYDRYYKIHVDEREIPHLLELVETQIHHQKLATDRMKQSICDYGIQIVGAYDRNYQQKVYFLYFSLYDIFDSEDKDNFQHIYDGGDSVFSGMIHTKNDKFRVIMVNGEA